MSLPLLHSPSEIVQWLMVSLGLGSDPTLTTLAAWPVYEGNEPEQPDNVLTVYNTTDQEDGRSMLDGEVWFHYGVQVRVRGTDDPTALVKAVAVVQVLSEQVSNASVTVGTAVYSVPCLAKFNRLRLGKEKPASQRNLYTVNCVSAIRRTT